MKMILEVYVMLLIMNFCYHLKIVRTPSHPYILIPWNVVRMWTVFNWHTTASNGGLWS